MSFHDRQNLRVQCTLEWCFLQSVLDCCWGSVLQQRLYDALVTPASCNVQGCVSFLVTNIQSAGLDIIVDQGLHTILLPVGAGQVQRGVAVVVLHLSVGLVVQQQQRHTLEAFLTCQM